MGGLRMGKAIWLLVKVLSEDGRLRFGALPARSDAPSRLPSP
jgi:hypothetical protein